MLASTADAIPNASVTVIFMATVYSHCPAPWD